jgi:glycosyltransferase involved in cell wall biosynthesis
LIIGFDLQALQTEQSRNRGIGRYTENLINKIIELNSSDNYKLFLNGNYKEKVNVKLDTKSEIITISYTTAAHYEKNTANFLIQFLKYRASHLDIIQIFSAFEGFPSNLPVMNPYFDKLDSVICTMIYDFIPLHFPEYYLSNSDSKITYYKKLKTVYDSDILFADSESTRTDAINMLGINPRKVIYIGGATSNAFYKIENLSSKEIESIKKKYHINKKFVLYTGGIEFRKNVEKSIAAFSKIEQSLLDIVSYVIVCEINDLDKRRLTELAKKYGVEKNVIFTEFIPDAELNLLYNCCDVFLFPSLIEGFGLPVLEAMQCGAPVIGSDSSSIAELIEYRDFMFNPNNETEITLLINKILKDPEFRKKSVEHSLQRCKDFSWTDIAKKILYAYKSLENEISLKKSKSHINKPKIAFFSPLPPRKSGIAYYSATLLPLLSKYWDIDIFIDDYTCDDPYLVANCNIYSYLEFERIHQNIPYDEIIYQVGNSDNHVYMFDFIKKYPGVVVLHDVYLSGVIYWITAKIGKLDEFIDEVIYSHGEHGKELVNKAKKNLIPWDHLIWNLQINKRILDNATKIIVHSQWDKENILQLYPHFADRISLVHQFSPIRITIDKLKDKVSLGLSKDDFLICSFGFVVSTKKIDSIIKNLKTFLQNNPKCKYIIVGEAPDTYGNIVKNLIKELGLCDKVIFTDFVDDATYKKYLGICDVCISLRTNTRAGTSASINHALGAGLPTIISDEGPFSGFPDDVVIKVKPAEEKNLSKIIDDLYKNTAKLSDLGDKARTFAENNLSKDSCVEKYVIAVNKLLEKNEVT